MNREQRDALRLRLQASRLELIDDIEARSLECDMATTRRAPSGRPEVVFKTHDNSAGNGNGTIGDNGTVEAPPLSDEQIDILATALAAMRAEFRAAIEAQLAPVREEIAELRGLRDAVLTLINNKARSLSGRKRAPRLLEPPK